MRNTDLNKVNHLFPVFLKLEELHTLIVGGGNVGMEKLSAIMTNYPCARVTVIGREITPALRRFAFKYIDACGHAAVVLQEKTFEEKDLNGKDIVILATANRELNKAIREQAKVRGLLVNVADTPDLCDFYLGSIVQKGNLKLGISTNGKSPTLAKRLREILSEAIPDDLDDSLDNLEELRKYMKGDFAAKVKRLNEITSVLVQNSQSEAKK